MDVVVNYWAVIGAAAAAIVLGSVWYGPLFGRQWMRIVGISKADMEAAGEAGKRMMMRSYVIMGIGTLVMAYVLAHVLTYASAFTGTVGADAGIAAGLSIWIGFIAPAMLGNVIWEGRPWKYWFITAGYYLVSLILMGIILAVAS